MPLLGVNLLLILEDLLLDYLSPLSFWGRPLIVGVESGKVAYRAKEEIRPGSQGRIYHALTSFFSRDSERTYV